MLKKITTIALYSIPLTGVFKLSERISLPMVLFSLIFILDYKNIVINKIRFSFILFLIILCSLYLTLNLNSRSLLYTFSIFFSCIIYFQGSKHLISLGWDKIAQHLILLVFICNSFIIYEFITRNIYPDLFFDFQRKDGILKYEPLFLSQFIRARGFAEESGHMGLFYEFSIPLILEYSALKLKKTKKYFLLFSTLAALFFIFSPFTLTMIIAFFIAWLLKKNKRSLMFLVLIFFVLLNSFYDYMMWIWKGIYIKISFSPKDFSSTDRLERVKCFLSNIDTVIYGIGPFNFSSVCPPYDSSLNLFVDVLVSFGLFVFLLLCCALSFIFIKAYSLNKWGVFISLAIISIHYLLIANFWYPFIWVTIGLIFFSNQKWVIEKNLL